MSDIHFEALRADLDQLSVPQGQVRHMRWLVPPLAIGRVASGDFEVFVRGPELHTVSSLVKRHVQHGEWRPEEGGAPFSANRIVLPSTSHFASIATLIAIELMRAGIAGPRGVQPAFTHVEPIIEMAIRGGALSENVVTGLLGELSVLRQLILFQTDRPGAMMRCLDFWQGWQEGGRDFRIGSYSIEVKTTQSGASIHEFSGLHQLEPMSLPSGAAEQLKLMSLGLASSSVMGETLPSMVSSIVMLLSTATSGSDIADEFLHRVSLYGSQSGAGYVHGTMREWAAYGARYTHTFLPRLYRIDDPAMRLLRRDLLADTFVQTQRLSFSKRLGPTVSPC
ncbi:PD-(D/E)XK motif protein [Paraburkholderia sp. BCC1885]|uniref:PD-(D/E)XK motif protein n=1 Tax=Paraburkholderia sp. BCC1885 TaxID=2562669 RepID=UPI001184580B|nr:PD-(D/E)XK motif protein [Paraburkholderia sp. BCC1885]